MFDLEKSLKNLIEKKEAKSGISYSIFICLFIIVSTIIGLIYMLLNKSLDGNFIPSLAGYAISTGAILAIFNKGKKREDELFKKFNPLYLVLSVILSLGMLFGFGFINTLFSNLLEKIGAKVSNSEIDLSSFSNYLFALLGLAIAPAFFEEIIFRHFVLNGIKGRVILGSILSALCFSLYHLSLSQLIYQFIYGFMLSVLAIKAKSIIPSILAHFLNNFIILTLEYFNLELNLFSPVIIVIGLVLIAIFIFFTLIYKREKREKEKVDIIKFLMGAGLGIIISIMLVVGVSFG